MVGQPLIAPALSSRRIRAAAPARRGLRPLARPIPRLEPIPRRAAEHGQAHLPCAGRLSRRPVRLYEVMRTQFTWFLAAIAAYAFAWSASYLLVMGTRGEDWIFDTTLNISVLPSPFQAESSPRSFGLAVLVFSGHWLRWRHSFDDFVGEGAPMRPNPNAADRLRRARIIDVSRTAFGRKAPGDTC